MLTLEENLAGFLPPQEVRKQWREGPNDEQLLPFLR